jgi:hypothetical protein
VIGLLNAEVDTSAESHILLDQLRFLFVPFVIPWRHR